MGVKVSHFQECTSSGLESVARKKKKTQKINKPLDVNNLIYAVPRNKTVNNLHLWNVSLLIYAVPWHKFKFTTDVYYL